MIIICEASEKFKPFQDDVCGMLFEMLRELAELEKDIFERDRAYNEQKLQNGIPKNQIYPEWKDLMDEYRMKYKGIVERRCTEKLLKRGYAGSFGSPQKYGYIDGECMANFKMRAFDKATVETHYKRSLEHKQKFSLVLIDGKWLLDAVYYGFENDKTWHVDNI